MTSRIRMTSSVPIPTDTRAWRRTPAQRRRVRSRGAWALEDRRTPKQLSNSLGMLNEQLNSHVLAKDLHVAESLRACPPGEFSARFIDELYKWNAGAGITLPERDVIGGWGSQWSIFPNFKFHPLYGNSIAYRSRPDSNDPEHCYFEMWSLTLYPEGEEPRRPELDGEFALDDEQGWPLIARQDYINIERQQRGLRMPGLEATRLATKYEDGISNLHAHLTRIWLAGAA